MGVKITINSTELKKNLEKIVQKIDNLKPLMADIGSEIEASTKKRFEDEVSPAGEKWTPSIEALLNNRKTLSKSGLLKISIQKKVLNKSVLVGSDRIYAAIQQLGGKIRAKNTPNLVFKIGAKIIRKKEVYIPPRPYLGISKTDENLVVAHIKRAVLEGLS
jgi:phage virion morphogenesis protein